MVNLMRTAAAGTGGACAVLLLAGLAQFAMKTITLLGYRRAMSPLASFGNYECEKVTELGLEACEDMWLHEASGHLYMACSNAQATTQWLPAVNHLNASGRSLVDRIAVLDTRGPGLLASRIKWLTIENYSGINGDGTLNLHGFDVRADRHTGTLRIVLINHRPPIEPVTGKLLDATKIGANSTMEIFQTSVGSDSMRHIRTIADPLIVAPNRVQWVSDDAFMYSNDHNTKVGLRRELELLTGGGNIGYCDRNRCNIAYSFGHDFVLPNGLVRGHDGLIYVPSTFDGEVHVFSLNQHHMLEFEDSFTIPYPVDNLSVDQHGIIYAAALPKLHKWIKASKDPFNVEIPTAVFKISGAGKRRDKRSGRNHGEREKEYVIEKVVEDDGSTLPGTTIVVHDTETGRLFLGGVISPWIGICEKR